MVPILPYYPWIIAHPPVIPKLYYGAISIEQRTLEMAKKICGIESYLGYLSQQIAGLEDDIKTYIDDAMADIEQDLQDAISLLSLDLHREMDELREWVEAQAFSTAQWDVTRGLTTTSVEAMRRIFADVTVDGTTVDRLTASTRYQTVDALAASGWNCRALAVIGATVLDETYPQQWRV